MTSEAYRAMPTSVRVAVLGVLVVMLSDVFLGAYSLVESQGHAVLVAAVSAVAILGVDVLAFVLVYLGYRSAPYVLTLIALWIVASGWVYQNLFSIIPAVAAGVAATVSWLPSSTSYYSARRACRLGLDSTEAS